MRRNPNFIQLNINDNLYLLPTGQGISDLERGIRINKTGAYLWELLSEERSLSELLTLSARRYELSPEDAASESFCADITDFLDTLRLRGMLLTPLQLPSELSIKENGYCHTLSIAGLRINLYGPTDAFAPEFADFYEEYTDNPDQTVRILYGNPATTENGAVLIRNPELTVMELPEKYIILFTGKNAVRELHLLKDASLAYLYCSLSGDTLREDLFHALRFAFLYLAQKHDILAVHSASILYREKAWLFSAPSGTGKSTHAALWHNILHTPYLNGDLNLIGLRDGIPQVYGLPWCGTSGIYDTHTHKLGGIIFLRQAVEDSISELSADERILALAGRIISPCFDEAMLRHRIAVTTALADSPILLCRLCCTPNPSAFQLMKQTIDTFHNPDKA